MQHTVLVVEDDPMIRDLVKIYLENAGYHVVTATDGEEALQIIPRSDPCFIILDLMLPKKSGEEVCQWVREQGLEVAVLMLTAKVSSREKIAGLKMGADDYVTKPFSPEELVVRVETILRRTGHACQKVTHNGLTIKPRKGEVELYGSVLSLTKIEFTLLYHFMRHPHTLFSREQLLEQIYPLTENIVQDRTIDVHIKHLREKIEDDPSSPKRIITVRGMGYKFVV
ncbi:two-component system, OmpR family, alkaline phosphatase synthesis response regulator PhoP [Alteribacillus persepolensis]|uniref:Two-component system, OmpR family, alkaline phosphatase synthesis response regulator PhoP n=1 Tax=Alteribacillus persepolensis TaxID=568899 RepID=A0A1G8FW61_9BACI|nr:response regulator transcription factor [Alteribacillus persepolensis]SDH86409.1 two-component system, OmpR family, alkaline phosphatase synthesis response regulator PhoP [Alteribacillus persepolensis]